MVKNTKGGKGQKRMGRKFVSSGPSNHLRTPDANEPAEMYACVSKLLGNGMAHVVNTNGTGMLLHIRNKFRGRGKRDNTLRVGGIVLVGERTFESAREGKLNNCDLLEVYNDHEINRLKQETYTTSFDAFKEIHGFEDKEPDEDELFAFTNNDTSAIDREIEESIQKERNPSTCVIETFVSSDDELDIDDI